MLFATSAQKTLSDIIRDYRQGELTNPPAAGTGADLPGPEHIFGITYGPSGPTALKFAPGDIVPLITTGPSPTLGISADLDNEAYQTAALYGPSKKTFLLREMPEERSNIYAPITVRQFGVAVDFISPLQHGAVQVSGFVWVPFEDIPALQTPRKFVILRKNERHGGKPFLQAAADGTAEIIRTDTSRTREDGFTWGLIRLGTPYRGTLSRLPADTESMEPFQRVFHKTQEEGEYSTDWNDWKMQSVGQIGGCSSDLKAQFRSPRTYITPIDPYDAEKQNFVRIKRVQELDLSSLGDFIYIDRETGEITASNHENDERSLTRWPDYIDTPAGLQPFTGGIYPATCISKTEIVVLGRTLSRNELFTNERDVDIWPGDSVYVRVFIQDTYGSYCGPYELVHCPKDDPTGTLHLYVGGGSKYMDGHRGWKYVDIKSTYTAQNPNAVGVLVGNREFLPFTVHHKHQDSDDIAYITEDVSRVYFQEVFNQFGYFEKVEYGMEFNHGL